MPPAEPVLICGLTGRALAQSARAAGFAPIVLDAFADLDTRAAAEAVARVPVDRAWRLRRRPLLEAAARLAPGPVPLVCGSGFERAPGLLAALAAGRPLWGTPPARVQASKDPFGFAAVAHDLGVPHPEVSAFPPSRAAGWLRKRAGAAGGGHVRAAAGAPPRGRGWYWQRHVPGEPVSALVLGDGRRAMVLGLTRQWAAAGLRRRFRFGGVAAPAFLLPLAAERLTTAAVALAGAFGLVGLGSVDALVAGDRLHVLELNPRAGASLDACEQAYGINLFRLHHNACHGRLPDVVPQARTAAGSAIVYARRALRVPRLFAWPDWARDLSPGGTAIPAGGPVCTVLAQAADPATVRTRLAARTAEIRAMLGDAQPSRCRAA